MFNVIKSVTRNGRSILLTALLALILVYLFSIVGFLFLKDDFILEVDRLPDSKAKGCSALVLVGCGAWAREGQSMGPLLQPDRCMRPRSLPAAGARTCLRITGFIPSAQTPGGTGFGGFSREDSCLCQLKDLERGLGVGVIAEKGAGSYK